MKTVRSVERAVSILFLVCQSNAPLRLSEIGRLTDLDNATALRLLNTLVKQNLIQQDNVSRRYMPGTDINRFYSFWHTDIRNVCRPHMETLLKSVQETVCLIVPRGLERVCVDVLQPNRELRVVAAIGRALPIHLGASGRVLLAFKQEEEIERILEFAPLESVTEKTVTDHRIYTKQLAMVREKGYALSFGDVTEGTSALAAPIFDNSGNNAAAAAIAIRGPEARMTRKKSLEMAPALLEATAAMSAVAGPRTS